MDKNNGMAHLSCMHVYNAMCSKLFDHNVVPQYARVWPYVFCKSRLDALWGGIEHVHYMPLFSRTDTKVPLGTYGHNINLTIAWLYGKTGMLEKAKLDMKGRLGKAYGLFKNKYFADVKVEHRDNGSKMVGHW